MSTVILLALAVAAISITTAKMAIFRSLRLWIFDRSEWLGELVKCPYCTAHWLAFAAVAAYQPRLVHSGTKLLDYFTTAMVIVAISAVLIGVIWGSLVIVSVYSKREE